MTRSMTTSEQPSKHRLPTSQGKNKRREAKGKTLNVTKHIAKEDGYQATKRIVKEVKAKVSKAEMTMKRREREGKTTR